MRVLPLPPLPDIEAVFFRLENQGSRYTLCRDVDVPKPVRHEGLTLDEVEEILNTWKLHGLHAG